MISDNDIKILEEALDIFEQKSDLSSAQLAALQSDGTLQDDVALIHTVRETLHKDAPIDVEARLAQFHKKVSKPSFFHAHRTLIVSILSATAILAGVIFYLHTPSTQPEQIVANGTVFSADNKKGGITLTTDNGDAITLAPTGQQSRSISLSDFKQVLAEIGVSERVTLDVPYGSSADITLPDGTVVYMHPGAHLIFPNKFIGDRREVVFNGEAYFKVAHDASHPFVISSGNMETTVLGTEFNLNTERSSVTLVKGSVRLRETESNAEVLLKPHQQAVLSADKGQFAVNAVNVEPYEFWRDGYLYFEQAELKDIMEAIGKNFNMSVVFKNDEALHYRMRFITLRNKGVEAAIQTMNEMGKAHVAVKGDVIYVY